MVMKLPRLFDIFSPSTCRKPLCIQTLAMTSWPKAQRVWAISSRGPGTPGRCRRRECRRPRRDASGTWPSIRDPARAAATPGAVPAGSPSFDGFHSTKSISPACRARLRRGRRRSCRRASGATTGRNPAWRARRTAHGRRRHRRGRWRSAFRRWRSSRRYVRWRAAARRAAGNPGRRRPAGRRRWCPRSVRGW